MNNEQKPVAWMMINNTFDMSPSLHWTLQKWDASWKPIPLYIHPAPDVVKQLVEALEQLMSIVTIHSRATSNSFAWAEMDEAKEALAAAKEAGYE